MFRGFVTRSKGTGLLELGINEEGHVVSACVPGGVLSDFDQAAHAAARGSLWTPKVVRGKRVGVVVTVTFDTPDVARGSYRLFLDESGDHTFCTCDEIGSRYLAPRRSGARSRRR
jgi:hypothetical protein